MRYVAVVGSGECSPEIGSLAYEVGKELARRNAIVLCGGKGGVMTEVARGVREEGGVVIGILPGTSRTEGNPYLSFSLPTGLGEARNAVIACAADVLIAVGGGYGTLSEVALALKRGKKVIGLAFSFPDIPGVIPAFTPAEAVDLAFSP